MKGRNIQTRNGVETKCKYFTCLKFLEASPVRGTLTKILFFSISESVLSPEKKTSTTKVVLSSPWQ